MPTPHLPSCRLTATLASDSQPDARSPARGQNVAWTKGHYKLVNWLPAQFLILFASAWSLTENYPCVCPAEPRRLTVSHADYFLVVRRLALITCAIYYGAGIADKEPFNP